MKLKLYIFISLLVLAASCSSSEPLKVYKDASNLREKAVKYELQDYSKEQFDIAETNFSEAVILIDENKDPNKILELLTSASNSYQTVLDEGLPKYAVELKEEIDLERLYSKDIKAYKIDKDNYELAELNYLNAMSALGTNDYEGAVSNFLLSKKFHNKAYFSTKGIFEESSTGIKEAEQKLTEIEELKKSATNN